MIVAEKTSTDQPGTPNFIPRNRRHYPGLDGVRGIAFLAVFLSHYYTMVVPDSAWGWGGWLGVDLFFVLSGFLITGILFDSLHKPRYFRNFYIRRALRIFPLYYSTWAIFLVLTPWLHPLWTRFDIARVFYYGNLMDFEAARHPEIQSGGFMFYTPGGHFTGFNTGVLWSLCLEEQFYLIWPLVVFLIKKRHLIMRLCIIGVACSFVLNCALVRWAMHANVNLIFLYNATYAHYSPMLFGAWLALWLRGPKATGIRPSVVFGLIAVPGLLLFSLLRWGIDGVDMAHPLVPTVGYLCSSLLSVGILLAAMRKGGLAERLFSLPALASMGTISYGLYIVHGFLMGAFRHNLVHFQQHGAAMLMPITAFAITFVIAWLSYRFYERPFLQLKDKWAPNG